MSKLNKLCAAAASAVALMATGASAQMNLSAETAGQGGVPGTVMSHLAEASAAAGVANIQVQYGQTLTNSVQNVAEGKTDITGAPLVLPFLLSKGRGPYSKLGADAGAELASNLRVLYTYSYGFYTLYAYDSVGLKGWDDIKGRKVYNGPPRGAALVQARAVTQLITGLKDGDDYEGVQVNWAQDVKTITDGSAAAMVLPTTFPDRRVTAGLASGKMTVWSIPKDKFESEAMKKYMSSPGNAPFTLKISESGFSDDVTVVSDDDMIRTSAIAGSDVVHKDMDFDTAKALTAAFIATIPDLKAKVPWGGNVGLGVETVPESGMCGALEIKYHPGAVAAWEEAGFQIPDCAK